MCRCEILHFVDHHEVVAWCRLRTGVLCHQAKIEQAGFDQPRSIFFEQVIQPLPAVCRKNRLAYPQCQVFGAAQHAARTRDDDATDFLEGLMCLDVAKALPHPRKPRSKVTPTRLTASRHANRFDELTKGQEAGVLTGVLEAMGVIQVAGALRQIGRMRDI